MSRGPSIINVKIENACMSVNLQGLKFVRGETRYARILRNAHAMHAYRCSIINVKTATARLSALISTQRDGRINETSARLCAAHHRACKKLYEESRESDSLTNLIATRWNVQRNS